jgi:hypothetical protein
MTLLLLLSQKQTQLLLWVPVSRARSQLLSSVHDLYRVQHHTTPMFYSRFQIQCPAAGRPQICSIEAGQTNALSCSRPSKKMSCNRAFLQRLNKYTILAADKVRPCVAAGAVLQQAKQMLCLTAGRNLAAAKWCLTWP